MQYLWGIMLFQLCLVWAFIQGGTDKKYVFFQLILQLKTSQINLKILLYII